MVHPENQPKKYSYEWYRMKEKEKDIVSRSTKYNDYWENKKSGKLQQNKERVILFVGSVCIICKKEITEDDRLKYRKTIPTHGKARDYGSCAYIYKAFKNRERARQRKRMASGVIGSIRKTGKRKWNIPLTCVLQSYNIETV